MCDFSVVTGSSVTWTFRTGVYFAVCHT